jgi:predicted enzyme related to lactoylglutathione lyase
MIETALALALATSAHFHHVHLNVTDTKATIAFYEKFFGASEVRYRGLSASLTCATCPAASGKRPSAAA